ncbi:MAG TPA: hypothetical protein VL981_13250 [Candidatus Methylacidiphilales bacterium]|nr:hypothetical protein [Candidatus Methylacidiphilales bacterium]
MKKILALILGIALATYGTVALADDDNSVTFSLKKISDSKAKLSVWPDAKPTATVSISFDSGADWSDVKDSYSVTPDVASGLEAGKISISIGTDGTATFHLPKK